MESQHNERKAVRVVLKVFLCALITLALYIEILPIFTRIVIAPMICKKFTCAGILSKQEGRNWCESSDMFTKDFGFVNNNKSTISMWDGFSEAATLFKLCRTKLREKPIAYDPKMLKLFRAIEAIDVKKMQKLIDSGLDVNAVDKDCVPALIWALPYGRRPLECLLKNGADPNIVFGSSYGRPGYITRDRSLLYVTLKFMYNYDPMEGDRVGVLLKYGADPNLGNNSPLCLAANWGTAYDYFDQILEAGAKVDVYDRSAHDFLITKCVKRGYYGRALALLEHGATYDPETPQGAILKSQILYRLRKESEAARDKDFRKLAEWLKEHDVFQTESSQQTN